MAGLTAFCVSLAAVAAATSALSYAGIRAIAQQGGIQEHYARGYPLLIDALLVIVLAAVLALRGAGLPSRILSWLALLVLLVAAAGAEALHATGRRLPRDAAAITVAVLPWLLVLVTFVLLLAMLRHARSRQPLRAAGTRQHPPPATPLPVRTPQPWNSATIVPGSSSRLVSSAAAGAAAGRAAAEDAPGPAGGTAQPAAPEPQHDSSPAPGPIARDVSEQQHGERPGGPGSGQRGADGPGG